MAYPVLESSSTNTATSSTTVAVTTPSNLSVGDLLIFVVGNDSAAAGPEFNSGSVPGFEYIHTDGTSGVDCYVATYYRYVDGTEASSYTATGSGTVNMFGQIHHFSGVWPGYAVGIHSGSGGSGSGPMTVTGVTSTATNALSCYAWAFDGGDCTFTHDSGYTAVESKTGTTAGDSSGGFAYKEQASAGAIANATVSGTASDGYINAGMFMIYGVDSVGDLIKSVDQFDGASSNTPGYGLSSFYDWIDATYDNTGAPDGTKYVKIDAGESIEVSDIVFKQTDATRAVTSVKLEGSDNDSTWTSVIASTAVSTGTNTISADSGTLETYRYWRLTETSGAGPSDWRVHELQLWADTTQLTPPGSGGGGSSSLHGDALYIYLQQNETVTSKELVGALNELNGTSGVEYDLARRTYLGL